MRIVGTALLFASSIAGLPASAEDHYSWGENSRRFEVVASGAVEFSDDDRDVKRLSPDGYFRVEESFLLVFSGRWYEVRADSAGRLSRAYYDHGEQRPLEQGQAWLMRAMPEAIRHTALGAGPRLQRILRQGGPAAALTEISRIEGDGSKRVYLEEFVTKSRLAREPLEDAMLQARKIGSDDDKSELLKSVASFYLKDGLREPIFRVAGSIGSDDNRAGVLCEFIDRDPASHETLRLAAKAASRIGSDDEKAKLLVRVAERYNGDREIGRALLASANTIGSDDERRRVLVAVLASGGKDRDTLTDLLRAGAGISSDDEKAAVLVQAAPRFLDYDFTRRAFFEAAGSIGSDDQRRKVLSALLRNPSLTDESLAQVAHCAQSMGSDDEKAGVLVEMAPSLRGAAARRSFFEAADSIGSADERKKVLIAASRHAGNNADVFEAAARSVRRLEADDEKAEVLVELVADHAPTRDDFFAAVDSIGSEDQRYNVLLAVLADRRIVPDAVVHIIDSTARMGSDNLKADILTKIVQSPAGDNPQVRAAIRQALRSIQSDGEYRRIMSAYTKQ